MTITEGFRMKGLGLRAKLAMGFGILLVLLVLVGSVGYYSTKRVATAGEDVVFSLKRKEVATSIELGMRKQIRSALNYVFNGDQASLQEYSQDKQGVEQHLTELGKTLTTEKGKALFSKIRQSSAQMTAITDQEIVLRQQARSYEANDMASGPKTEAAVKAFVADCDELEAWEDKLAQDDLKVESQTESQANRMTLSLVGCGLLLGIVVAMLIARSITNSLTSMLGMIQKVSAKDLAVSDIEITSSDEIGEAKIALNRMKNTLHEMVKSIASTAQHLAKASEEISSGAGQSAETARVQADQTRQVAVAMQEMSSTVQNVSEHSQKAADSSHNAAEAARQGGTVVEHTLSTMRSIADSSKTVAARIAELGNSSEQIGKIVAVIDDLSDQTNLLALNAAIEAARAGEQGRGFAVVADEVRKLAERTTKATQAIGAMVESIQVETRSAVEAIELGSHDVEVGVEKTAASGAALKEIIQMSEQVGDMITQIATAATQQSSATEQVNSNVAKISSLTEESSLAAEHTAKACAELSTMAIDLQNLVNQFKLGTASTSRTKGNTPTRHASALPSSASKAYAAAAGR
jgi:methyl-accepting chemotaxis protein